MIRRPPRSTQSRSSAASDVYKRQEPDVRLLTARLRELGDSLAVAGAEGTWNVHVHVDDVGAAVEAGIEAGRPHRIAVTRFADRDARVPPVPPVPASSAPHPGAPT